MVFSAKNLDLFDSWSELYDVEKDPEAKEAMKKHIDSMDLILGWLEKTLEYKDETVRALRWKNAEIVKRES